MQPQLDFFRSEETSKILCYLLVLGCILAHIFIMCGIVDLFKESLYIRVTDPTLNRNVGKYNLWDRVLFNTPDLKINNDNGHAHRTSLSGHAQSIPTYRHLHRTMGHTGHALNSEHAHRTS